MHITPEDWQVVSKLFDQALELPDAARATWLDKLLPEYAVYEETLRAMLETHAKIETSDFLHTVPKIGPESPLPIAKPPSAIVAGTLIGPYVLEAEIGRGGMGEVWRAHRADGVMQRTVALKLPLLHLRNPQLIERFEREREILAAMTHPQIARLYDAGVDASSQPYLAMEYVDGAPLIEYCDRQRYDLRSRLQLFLQVLDAVQFAHSRLVIHRDLKPANMLVGADGRVMLLDFGIAKLVDDAENDSMVTQLGGRAFTPDYASPEQITGETLGTASDIFSLGVVLYELLSGSRPFATSSRRSRKTLERAVLRDDPDKPSVSSIDDRHASHRSTTRSALRNTLKGDLDTIVLKALQKSPSDRYATAQAFAADLERYLNSQPVLARPDSAAYRAKKFVARNKLAVCAAVALVATLAAGMATTAYEARVARSEQRHAKAVQGFLIDIFRSNSAEQQDPLKGRQTTAQELLDIGAKRIEEKLKAEPEAQQEILDVVADMYFEMGLSDDATKMRQRRIEVLRQIYGAHSPIVADALLSFAEDVSETADRSQLFAALTEAQDILNSRDDRSSPTRGRLLLALTRYYRYVDLEKCRDYADLAVKFFRDGTSADSLGRAMRFAGKCRDVLGEQEEALSWHRQVVELARKRGVGSWLIVPLDEQGESEFGLLKLPEAEASYREAVSLGKKYAGDAHIQTVQAQLGLGRFLYSTSRRSEGRSLLQATLQTVQHANIASGELPEVMGFYGLAVLFDGLPTESAPYIAADVDDLRKNYPNSTPLSARLATQGMLFTELGRFADADKVLREALEIKRKSAGTQPVGATENLLLLRQATLAIAMEKPSDAIDILQRIAPPAHAARMPLLLDDLSAKTLLSAAYLQQEKEADAIKTADEVLARLRASPLRDYYQTVEAEAAFRLGEAQLRSRDPASARANIERSLELRLSNENELSPRIAQAEIALANCAIELGDRATGIELYARAASIESSHRELGAQYTKPLADLAKRLGMSRANGSRT